MKKTPKLINFPDHIVKAIEEYQIKNGISTFTATVLELVRTGIEKERT